MHTQHWLENQYNKGHKTSKFTWKTLVMMERW